MAGRDINLVIDNCLCYLINAHEDCNGDALQDTLGLFYCIDEIKKAKQDICSVLKKDCVKRNEPDKKAKEIRDLIELSKDLKPEHKVKYVSDSHKKMPPHNIESIAPLLVHLHGEIEKLNSNVPQILELKSDILNTADISRNLRIEVTQIRQELKDLPVKLDAGVSQLRHEIENQAQKILDIASSKSTEIPSTSYAEKLKAPPSHDDPIFQRQQQKIKFYENQESSSFWDTDDGDLEKNSFDSPHLVLNFNSMQDADNIGEDANSGSIGNPGSVTNPGSNSNPGLVGNPGSNRSPGSVKNPGSNTNPGLVGNPGSNSNPGSVKNHGSISNPGLIRNPGPNSDPGLLHGNSGTNSNPGFFRNPGSNGNPGFIRNPVPNTNYGFIRNPGATGNPGFIRNPGATGNHGFIENFNQAAGQLGFNGHPGFSQNPGYNGDRGGGHNWGSSGQNVDADGWRIVQRRQKVIKGSRSAGHDTFKAAPKKFSIFLGKMDADATAEQVISHIRNDLGIGGTLMCNKLSIKTNNHSAFKITVDTLSVRDTLLAPDSWYEGMEVHIFTTPRSPALG